MQQDLQKCSWVQKNLQDNKMVELKKKIWVCKLGEIDAKKLPPGADLPMRRAVRKAYFEVTGEGAEFIFSGWGGELNEVERAIALADMEIAYTGEKSNETEAALSKNKI